MWLICYFCYLFIVQPVRLKSIQSKPKMVLREIWRYEIGVTQSNSKLDNIFRLAAHHRIWRYTSTCTPPPPSFTSHPAHLQQLSANSHSDGLCSISRSISNLIKQQEQLSQRTAAHWWAGLLLLFTVRSIKGLPGWSQSQQWMQKRFSVSIL